jgi:hypothetical protein
VASNAVATGHGAAAKAKKPRGRPRFSADGPRVKKSISLYPKVGAFLRKLGAGVVSHGVEEAARLYRGLTPEGVEQALARKPSRLMAVEVEKMSVSVSEGTYEQLLALGDGTFSHGVRIAAEVAMGLQSRSVVAGAVRQQPGALT